MPPILSFLFPRRCALCHANGNFPYDLCQPCYQLLPWLIHTCELCASSMPNNHGSVCGTCLKQRPWYDQCISLFHYAKPIDKLIMNMKFRGQLAAARLLSELLVERLYERDINFKNFSCMIAVPLHRNRLQERGFNQAVELAKGLKRKLNIPLDYQSCIRIKKTSTQSLLTAKKRRQNVKNAFIATKDFSKQKIMVIDDVVTTGHTVNELCKTLKRKGAAEIMVCCIARTDLSAFHF